MSDKHFEHGLRQRAANMRAVASMPGASGPLRIWVELLVDDADRLADLVAAVREEGHEAAMGACAICDALAALDEASRG